MEKPTERIKIDISTTTILKVIGIIIGIWFLYLIRDIVILFFIVLILVAALGPIVDEMAKSIPRVLAVIILSIIFLGILVILGFLLVPPVIEQIKALAIDLPSLAVRFGPVYKTIQNSISSYQQDLFNFSSHLSRLSGGIYSTTIGFISGIVAFVTALVLTFYMLIEQNALRNFINQSIPTDKLETLMPILRKIGFKMGSWVRGEALLMLFIGILDGIALLILGVPYALTLAVWGGLAEVIPYIGPWLGLVPALIIAFTISPLKALFVLITYIVIQQLESQFLAPKIMQKAVGLSPVIIILAILVGAKLHGILGVLIAVPVAAALAVIAQEWPELKKLRT